MYQEAFDFNGRPFAMAPFVKHFFREGPVQQAIEQINESIGRDAGPAIVIGQHGTGKSLLLAVLNEEYQQRFKVISLSCGPMSERRDLLQAILFELKQPYHDLSEGELRLALIDFIKPAENCPNGVLLLIDDAQALTTDLVDELKMITNFVREGVPRVRVVLCGTNRLEELLTEPKLEAFNQRLSTRCFLGNLTREQTRGYIHEHVNRVGGDAGTIFDQATTDAIHEATSGCPRFVNQLAEQCMIYAATHGSLVVEPQMVEPAWAQAQGLPAADTSCPAASHVESNDENWTVIEFGSLDDDETDGFSEPESVATEAVEASDDARQLGGGTDEDNASDSTAGFVSEQTTSENDDLWSDVGNSDPFVDAASEVDDDGPSAPETQADEGYSYQPINPELVQSENPETEAESIPTEVRDLNQEQESVWAAAGLAEDPTDSVPHSADAESPDSGSSDDEAGGLSASQLMAAAALPTIPAIAAAVSVANPFKETFESEEPVAKEFSELVAEQNASSAQVTGAQLDHLPTSDTEPEGDTGIPVVSLDEEVAATDEIQPTPEVEVVAAADDTQSPSEETESFAEVSEAEPTPAEPTPEPEYTTDDLASVFGSTGTEGTEAAYDQPDVSPLTSLGVTPPDTPLFPTPDPQTAGDFHEHNTAEPSADIQQQADDILSSMHTPEATDAAVEDTATSAEPEPGPTSVTSEDNVELSDAQRILSEILEQKNLLSDQVSLSENASALASSETEFPQSLPMPQPFSGDEVLSEGFETPESIEGSQPPADSPSAESTPLSIGRAERMDYERLFNQLRDTGDQS